MNSNLTSTMGSATPSPYLDETHALLRDQVRRFVEAEIKPHADQWEIDGCVPRGVLRKMGELGFFGIRYPETYGGAELDTLATAVFAEELGNCTYGGVAITALAPTDMAPVHIYHAGSPPGATITCRNSLPATGIRPSPLRSPAPARTLSQSL